MKVSPLPGTAHRATLDNGLEVLVLENRRAPIVTTALTYRVGARHDPTGSTGLAHFLEHMMFKGSAAYDSGAIDALTQQLGGDSNALTWHDATLYYFQFASDRWRAALGIEADRMCGLRLEAVEVEHERRVILEEIAAVEDDPWQVLEETVHSAFFGEHPYGRPILGSTADLATIGVADLGRWHDEHYGPGGAVLTIAGDVGAEALTAAAEAFADVASRGRALDRIRERVPIAGRRSVEIRQGVLPKWLAVLPSPHLQDPDFAAVRMAAAILGLGRMSRLTRELVDEEPLLTVVGCSVLDTLDPGCVTLTAEPQPGVDLDEVEARVFATAASLVDRPPSTTELSRIRNLLVSDWLFAHETIAEQAVTSGFAAACLDLDAPRRQLEAILAVDADEVVAATERWLDPDREAVIGRCLPTEVG